MPKAVQHWMLLQFRCKMFWASFAMPRSQSLLQCMWQLDASCRCRAQDTCWAIKITCARQAKHGTSCLPCHLSKRYCRFLPAVPVIVMSTAHSSTAGSCPFSFDKKKRDCSNAVQSRMMISVLPWSSLVPVCRRAPDGDCDPYRRKPPRSHRCFKLLPQSTESQKTRRRLERLMAKSSFLCRCRRRISGQVARALFGGLTGRGKTSQPPNMFWCKSVQGDLTTENLAPTSGSTQKNLL